MKYSRVTNDFFQDVYELCKLIPVGRVTTYGHIAAYLGRKGGARMVGWAMNASHQMPGVPAHRVVNRSGLLTGKYHFGTPNEMQFRLQVEGVEVCNDKVVNFSALLWDPGKELL